jgi:hypothetical protein
MLFHPPSGLGSCHTNPRSANTDPEAIPSLRCPRPPRFVLSPRRAGRAAAVKWTRGSVIASMFSAPALRDDTLSCIAMLCRILLSSARIANAVLDQAAAAVASRQMHRVQAVCLLCVSRLAVVSL